MQKQKLHNTVTPINIGNLINIELIIIFYKLTYNNKLKLILNAEATTFKICTLFILFQNVFRLYSKVEDCFFSNLL